jgi:hypothetical protein
MSLSINQISICFTIACKFIEVSFATSSRAL